MITRGMQRISYTPGTFSIDEPIRFDHLVQSWQQSTAYPRFAYSGGIFTIFKATLSDYLVTWTFYLKTGTVLDGLKYNFLFDIDYPTGEVTEGCVSSLVTTSGIIQGIKILHIKRPYEDDILTFSLKMNTFANTLYLVTPNSPLPENILETNIANATLSIISI